MTQSPGLVAERGGKTVSDEFELPRPNTGRVAILARVRFAHGVKEGLLENVEWEAAANGTNHGGYGLYFSGRERARFGELYRNRGMWAGVQVVPAEWTDAATVARCTTPAKGQYGYHFWVPNLPSVFGTRGAYGQYLYVSRDLGLVVAFTAYLPVSSAGDRLDGLMREYILPAVK